MVQRNAGRTGQPVFLLGRSDRKSGGAASQWEGAASQNGTQSICKNIPCTSLDKNLNWKLSTAWQTAKLGGEFLMSVTDDVEEGRYANQRPAKYRPDDQPGGNRDPDNNRYKTAILHATG